MLSDLPTYERFIYTLPQNYPSIRQSTLVVIRHGAAFAELTGTVIFDADITLTVWEDLNFARRVVQGYSYAVSRGTERLYWYDPQPHPNDPTLATTFPHHKHIPPDIRHGPWLELHAAQPPPAHRRNRTRPAPLVAASACPAQVAADGK